MALEKRDKEEDRDGELRGGEVDWLIKGYPFYFSIFINDK